MKYSTILAVLDASVIFAILNHEPINSNVNELLDHSIATTYNIAEVVNKMVLKKKLPHDTVWIAAESIITHPYVVDMELSRVATSFSEIIDHSYGISLGDKYCLALGKILGKPVYTADRIWKKLEKQLGITIHLIR